MRLHCEAESLQLPHQRTCSAPRVHLHLRGVVRLPVVEVLLLHLCLTKISAPVNGQRKKKKKKITEFAWKVWNSWSRSLERKKSKKKEKKFLLCLRLVGLFAVRPAHVHRAAAAPAANLPSAKSRPTQHSYCYSRSLLPLRKRNLSSLFSFC